MSENKTDSIFSAAYWTCAAKEFRTVRSLIFAGLTIALGIALNLLKIPLGVSLRITPAFLAFVLGAAVFGPEVGLLAGLSYDLLGFFLFPSGVFFPGYTLSAMLEFFIYGLFLYRHRITVSRIFAAKFVVDFGVHVGLGALWSAALYGKAYYYYFVKSLFKNAVMLPIEVVALVLLFRVLLPVLSRLGILARHNGLPLF